MSDLSDLVASIETKESELKGLRVDLRNKFGMKMPSEGATTIFSWTSALAVFLGIVIAFVLMAVVAPFVEGSNILQQMATAAGWVGVLAVLSASVALIVACSVAWPDRFDKSWIQLDRILSSSGFYFFAGLALLLYAIHTTNSQIHPSLTFLLAMLGMAILLFGTGSHAVGSIATAGAQQLDPAAAHNPDPAAVPGNGNLAWRRAEASAQETLKAIKSAEELQSDAEKAAALAGVRAAAETAANRAAEAIVAVEPATSTRDWSPLKANAAVAGGAAVLAALFGYGVVELRSQIKDVFGYYDRYVKIRIDACAAFEETCALADSATGKGQIPDFSLSEYGASAELINGSSLYTIKSGNELQILVFSEAVSQNIPIILKLWRIEKNELVGPEIDDQIYLTINPETFTAKKLLPTVTRGPEAEAEVGSVPEVCRQFKGTTRVKCALDFVQVNNQGDQIYSVLYSLNFYRKENVISEGKINNVDVTFQ